MGNLGTRKYLESRPMRQSLRPVSSFAIILASLAAIAVESPSARAQDCTTTAFPAGLAPSTLDADARYGAAVAVSGNRAIVGAPDEDGGKGAAFIHEFDGTQWSAGLRLQPNDGVA